MRSKAFKMYLKPGMEEEYRRRHEKIWPELERQLRQEGIYDYSIFLDRDTNTLVGVPEEQRGNRIPADGRQRAGAQVVGLYGGYNRRQPGQLARLGRSAGSILHGIAAGITRSRTARRSTRPGIRTAGIRRIS